MSEAERPRILIVDDEEAILETMTFTFMDVYDVLTTSDPLSAMGILRENAPVAVVITADNLEVHLQLRILVLGDSLAHSVNGDIVSAGIEMVRRLCLKQLWTLNLCFFCAHF